MNEYKRYYWIEAMKPKRHYYQRYSGPHDTQDEATLAMADAKTFPLENKYRIVMVVETIVFEG